MFQEACASGISYAVISYIFLLWSLVFPYKNRRLLISSSSYCVSWKPRDLWVRDPWSLAFIVKILQISVYPYLICRIMVWALVLTFIWIIMLLGFSYLVDITNYNCSHMRGSQIEWVYRKWFFILKGDSPLLKRECEDEWGTEAENRRKQKLRLKRETLAPLALLGEKRPSKLDQGGHFGRIEK